MFFLAIAAVFAIGLIIYVGMVFNKSDKNQTNFEQIFAIIVLGILIIGCFLLGMIGAGEAMPMILAPFILLFVVFVYAAKEDRAKQYDLLEKMDKELNDLKNEINEFKADKKTVKIIENTEFYKETDSEQTNDGIDE